MTDESVAEGLRRVAREEVDDAIGQLRVKDDAKRDEAIHEARKSVKKLRGLVRLVMPQLGDSGKQDNIELRDAGRGLSEFRDAAALVETMDSLIEQNPGVAVLETVRGELANGAASRLRESGEVAQQAIIALRGFKKRVSAWELDIGGFESIAPGLKQTYRRGRKALAKAQNHASPVNLHDFRKRVKDHWYQVRLIESVWNRGDEAREQNAKDLQEWLGDDHNLVMLQEKLADAPARFGGEDAVAAVTDIIGKQRKELRVKAFEMGERLYEEKPGAFTRRVERLWNVWRSQSVPRRKEPKRAAATPLKRKSSAA